MKIRGTADPVRSEAPQGEPDSLGRDAALLHQLWASLPQVTYLFNLKTRSVHFIAGQENRPQGYLPDDFRELGDEVVPRLVHPDDLPAIDANFARLAQLRDGESILFRYRILHEDGTYRQMLDRQSVFSRTPEGAVELIFGIAEDITARERVNDEVRDLSERLLTLQVDERRRFAEELHDSTAQHLAAADLALGRIDARSRAGDAPAVANAIDDARQAIGEAKKEIRFLSYMMHPPGVSGTTLSGAVSAFALGFGTRAGLEMELRIPPQRNEVTDEVAVACFRVCQEALANVHRHAQATLVLVALDVGQAAVTLEVTDNGRGLDPASLESDASLGVGIPGMRERMGRLGGSVRFERAAPGTRMIATVPTSQHRAALGGELIPPAIGPARS